VQNEYGILKNQDTAEIFKLPTWQHGRSYCCHTVLQVSDLIAAKRFQAHSGPVLETLSIQNYGYDCFDFAAPPAAYPVRCDSCQLATVGLLLVVTMATLTLHASAFVRMHTYAPHARQANV
jgi:hypothetical protein